MELDPRCQLIYAHPIGPDLNPFYSAFLEGCARAGIEPSGDAFDQLNQVQLGQYLAYILSELPVASYLPSNFHGSHCFHVDLVSLRHNVFNPQFDLQRLKPLVSAVMAPIRNDLDVWDEADKVVEYSIYICGGKLKAMDLAASLRLELNTMHIDVPNLFSTISTGITGLETVSTSFFEKCTRDYNPRFQAEIGWTSWPKTITKTNLTRWLTEFTNQLTNHIDDMGLTPRLQKKFVVQPANNIDDVLHFLKTNVCFTHVQDGDHHYHASDFLLVGTLRCDPDADSSLATWQELSNSAREVFCHHYSRRFALGFTLCGFIMRIWLFDRAGGVSSQSFDINKDGKQFVDIMAAFILMDMVHLGFDTTMIHPNGQMFLDINRNGASERIVIDRAISIRNCVSGRATRCWAGHLEGYPEIPLVIKDSWQCSKQKDEGQILQKLTEKGVPHVARYYHHETVHIDGFADSTRDNVRKGLDISKAKPRHLNQEIPMVSSKYHGLEDLAVETSSGGRLQSSKATNRIHRRLIMRDYGKPIYGAGSPSLLLNALAKCIRGHEELYKAGILHRDISMGNLMIGQGGDSSCPAFIIDFGKAIEVGRASNSESNVGTKPFMAIGVLLGHKHTFMHDLESFFWVLIPKLVRIRNVENSNV
ncbi:hypothetical protein HOO65_020397 [Ceratocystis lukuohia]|uniref:EKC/KEOPS complex subunit BUD32 n=1 Tax=Ceratocystis lukuohia TaxID=2019550 RepID=A0ABR4MNJ7_9PEZI